MQSTEAIMCHPLSVKPAHLRAMAIKADALAHNKSALVLILRTQMDAPTPTKTRSNAAVLDMTRIHTEL